MEKKTPKAGFRAPFTGSLHKGNTTEGEKKIPAQVATKNTTTSNVKNTQRENLVLLKGEKAGQSELAGAGKKCRKSKGD